MILLRPRKLNETFRPVAEHMFDDAKKKIVAHPAVLGLTAEVDMTMIPMIPMMIFLERGTGDVSHIVINNQQRIDMQQEIAVETIHRLVTQARQNPDGNQNAENLWENKHSQHSV